MEEERSLSHLELTLANHHDVPAPSLSEMSQLQSETEVLAQEVSDLAQRQLQRCKDLQHLRGLASLARLRRRALAAKQEGQSLGQECEARASELKGHVENMAALRLRAAFLKEEAATAKAEASSVAGDAQLKMMEALEAELGAEDGLVRIVF